MPRLLLKSTTSLVLMVAFATSPVLLTAQEEGEGVFEHEHCAGLAPTDSPADDANVQGLVTADLSQLAAEVALPCLGTDDEVINTEDEYLAAISERAERVSEAEAEAESEAQAAADPEPGADED